MLQIQAVRRLRCAGLTTFLAACVISQSGCDDRQAGESAAQPTAAAEPLGSSAPVVAVDTSARIGSAAAPSPGTHRKEILSPVYTVDKIYRSMMGPQSTEQFPLHDTKDDEVLWIRGFTATMVDPAGDAPMPQDFMCHSNLDIEPLQHQERFGGSKSTSGRLFTLSQGQFEVKFPSGFGIPIMSSEKVSLTTQVLNLNLKDEEAKVRHKIHLDYLRDIDAKAPMKPLFVAGVYGLQLLDGKAAGEGYFGVDKPVAEQHGPGCLMGESASDDKFVDEQGRKFTGHWVVKPGREENRTLVTKILDLPFDTTVHYIAVHLHPFAESLELTDLTTGKSVYRAKARQFKDRIGLAHVDYFASEEGIPLYKDHEYELTSVYNNTTKEDQDSMAVMLLYLLDKEFIHPIKDREALDKRKQANEKEGVASPQAKPKGMGM